MKKITFTALLILLVIIPSVLAQSIEVRKIDKGSTIVSELSNPAIFDLVIDNQLDEGRFQIFSLVVPITPSSAIQLPHGESTIKVQAAPGKQFRQSLGFLSLEYEVRRFNEQGVKDTMLLKIVPLREVFEIEVEPFNIQDETVNIIIKNKQNTNLENIKFNLDSAFFSTSKTLSFTPNQEIEITAEINKNISKIKAGAYLLKTEIKAEDAKIEAESVIKYLEKENIFSDEKKSGFIVRTTTLERANVGNTELTEILTLKKDIISRLFTINSPTADSTERKGLSVVYTWNKLIQPGESVEILSTTNYTIPFIILLVIVLIAIAVKFYFLMPLTLSKKVSFVRTKEGHFALKVKLRIRAKKNLGKVQLIDWIPAMTKLYEKFARAPDKIEHESRKILWNFNSLAKGEEKILSYIIYSKLKVVGRFELPRAIAVFRQDDKLKRIFSNQAFFAGEI